MTILRHGFYEEEVYNTVNEFSRKNDVFWDIGANLGIHALTLKKAIPSADVYAFEPNAEMATLIRQAAQKNSLVLNVLELALNDRDGESKLFLHNGNSGRSSLRDAKSAPSTHSVIVTSATGDLLIERELAKHPNVIKIDIEGCELAALQGLSKTLSSSTLRAIVFEDNPSPDSRVKQLLSQYGFTITALSRLDSENPTLENYVASR